MARTHPTSGPTDGGREGIDSESAGSMASLVQVVARLRAPDGCPWDREQTHESLRPYLLEEAHEVLAALDSGDAKALCDELGDLLLQIVLHAQLAHEVGEFELGDVVAGIVGKIVRRHPHVFGDEHADSSADVLRHWEARKREERQSDGKTDELAHIPRTLPALALAEAVQRKSERGAMGEGRARSEVEALLAPPPEAAEERSAAVGRALWAAVALARAWGVDAEAALRTEASSRFGSQGVANDDDR